MRGHVVAGGEGIEVGNVGEVEENGSIQNLRSRHLSQRKLHYAKGHTQLGLLLLAG